METEQLYCFTHSNGEDIYLFTLRNANGTAATVTNHGATLTSYKIKLKNGSINDIVLGFDDPKGYFGDDYIAHYPWMGAAVGRLANRVMPSEFVLNGKKYILPANNGEAHLHGGPIGFDRRSWKLKSKGDGFLELTYQSPDGEQGYPGDLEVTIRFELNEANELSYQYTATTDRTTPLNLTHHAYFNLSNGEGAILDHELRIPASKMLEQDKGLSTTGKILEVPNTPFDFRSFHRINERLEESGGYDRSFIVDNKDQSLQLVAEARSGNIQLQVFSTEQILHFYSGVWMPKVKGKNGVQYGPYSGFCLETHNFPNAVNVPSFPETILKPGEVYSQKTVYKILEF
jgi:aldose 1-epimerase